MTVSRVVAVVEGHGECEAVPELIRRIARDIDPGYVVEVPHPIRVPASKLVKEGEIERSVKLAGSQAGSRGAVVVIVDCDDGCPAQEAPALLERARAARPDLPIAVILAKREFECWFLAAADSLRGRRGLPGTLQPPEDPESVRDAKGWLSNRMAGNRVYTETEDQAALTAVFDMTAARRADSFDKCYRDLETILRRLRARP